MKVYFERQIARLCGVHCLNSLLQGPYFTEIDLMEIARRMDIEERELMMESGPDSQDFLKYLGESSGNVSDDGNYSVQVLSEALKVWNLECIPLLSPQAESIRNSLLEQSAFICNFHQHWYTIRKIGGCWANLDSLQKKPTVVSDTYLQVLLFSLIQEGWTIFVILGELPLQSNLDSSNIADLDLPVSRISEEERQLQEAINLSLHNVPAPTQNITEHQPTQTTQIPPSSFESLSSSTELDAADLEKAIALSMVKDESSTPLPEPQDNKDINEQSQSEHHGVPVKIGIRRPDGKRNDFVFDTGNTVQFVFDCLKREMPDLKVSDFQLRRLHPRILLSDLCKTLQDYQITSSELLLLERK